MRFLLLGPLEARENGHAVALGGPKQRTVLAHLLLQANQVVTADRLIDALWGDEPPETARNTLQTYVRLLRKAVGGERIEHRSSGYVVAADPDELDVLRFDELVAESRTLQATDLPAAITALREALDLWRGPALDDLADQPSLRADIARLEEVRLAALEDRLSAELELGRHRELTAELETLVGRHPYRERMWGDLIVALYRSGRQGDALNAYRRARTTLLDDLGIDPSPELQRLQEQVLRQDPALELEGERLRGYRLQEQVGAGAFGTVYRAFQPEVGREVAVKVIERRLADDPEFIRRFSVEAQIVARLEHPHIVPLYDYWREPDAAYLVMRYLRGGSLHDALAGGPLDADRAVRVTDQTALALASAHRQGVIHRDVKSANILFDEDGNAYLSDFGIALDLAEADARAASGSASSPEALRGETLTPRTDVFGLGIVVYEMLTGRHPFADLPTGSLLERMAEGPSPLATELRPELPPSIDRVVARATAVQPADRYPDVMALAAAMREALEAGTLPPGDDEDLRNPYKGLLAFREADAADFFGREASVAELAGLLAGSGADGRFLAVVGASGSGKSSLVRAGLVPALRDDAVPGSGRWFVVDMVPGSHPFEELAEALTRIAIDPTRGLGERLRDHGMRAVAEGILPDDGSELLLVVDQFEEVFSLVADEDERSAFLDAIASAVSEPGTRMRVVITLRADFYDRPLQYRGFGELLARRTFAITPLAAAELERAVAGPAEAVGAAVEPALMSEIASEATGRPGSLPLLQYALTELFEARGGAVLTLEAYRGVGGVSGALARRAERLVGGFGPAGQEATRQLFLRLVAVGEDGSERTRRRTLRSELVSLGADRASMEAVIDAFGSRRLLTFDRDPVSRGPTVEIAHEALLREWDRLRGWIDDAEEQIRQHARVTAAATEWIEAGESEDYLLTGDRLMHAEDWLVAGTVAPTERERRFVGASRARADTAAAVELGRREAEARLEHRSVARLRALVAVLAAAALIAATLTTVAVSRSRQLARDERRATINALTAGALANLRTNPLLSLNLALFGVNEAAKTGEPVPAPTLEALHWSMQAAGIDYPVAGGPVKLVSGPFGNRGVYDLPIAKLLALARPAVSGDLPMATCEQYFGRSGCPPLPESFPDGLRAEPVRPWPTHLEQPLAGSQVTVFAEYDPGTDGASVFQEKVNAFTARTGIEVRLVAVPAFEDWLSGRSQPQDPPDIAYIPRPQGLATLAKDGDLANLAYLDPDRMREETSPYLVSLGSLGPDGSWPADSGTMYGVFARLDLKSLIWYPRPAFAASGYALPETWDGLLSLSNHMVADGHTPWCMGFGSGEASGWPGTDWIENLLLQGSGLDAYDRFTFHDLPFDSPEVRAAFERFGQIAFTDGYLRGGPRQAARMSWDEAQGPMVQDDPPGCWLNQMASFEESVLPAGSTGTQFDNFPFPPIRTGSPPALIGGGEMVAAFADRPEVRELMRYLLSPGFELRSSDIDHGKIAANQRANLASYQPFWRERASWVRRSLAADAFRYDASDLMPGNIGGDLFWKAMITYLDDGPGSLDTILPQLDAAWPDT